MQIYFHRQLFSHLSRVPILVEDTVSEIEIFCNIINVLIITFVQFKASLLNKAPPPPPHEN